MLIAVLVGSASFAFAGNVAVSVGGIGVSVGSGRHGTNVGVSIGNPVVVTQPVYIPPSPPVVVTQPVYVPPSQPVIVTQPVYVPAPQPVIVTQPVVVSPMPVVVMPPAYRVYREPMPRRPEPFRHGGHGGDRGPRR